MLAPKKLISKYGLLNLAAQKCTAIFLSKKQGLKANHLVHRYLFDNFGFEHSSLERVWSLEPDIIKLDRQFL